LVKGPKSDGNESSIGYADVAQVEEKAETEPDVSEAESKPKKKKSKKEGNLNVFVFVLIRGCYVAIWP